MNTFSFGSRATASDILDGVDLHGRRYVVTGGASGIGLETTRALAAAGAEVTVAVRRPVALEGLPSVRVAPLDLADLSSVAAFARSWEGRLDGLVANAGVMALPALERTSTGWEMQLAVNHLGHFALAHALRPALRDGGRVVTVSSGAHVGTPFDFADPQFAQRPYDPWKAYGQSKTADVLLAVGIAARWAAEGVRANSLAPGWIVTNLQRHVDDATLRRMGAVDESGQRVEQPFYKTPAQGASTSVMLVASPALAGVTGGYFEDNAPARAAGAPVAAGPADGTGGVAAHALDPEAAERLWTYAEPFLR